MIFVSLQEVSLKVSKIYRPCCAAYQVMGSFKMILEIDDKKQER